MSFRRILQRASASVVLASLCVFSGCGGPKKPDGLPKLTPCRVKLTQGNAPLADATVRLVYQGEGDAGRWAVAGASDEKGVAKIKTHGQFDGAPSGNFQVVVTKEDSENDGKTVKTYSLVENQYTMQTTTTLTLEVGDSPVDATFDLGAPVRDLVEEHAASTDP